MSGAPVYSFEFGIYELRPLERRLRAGDHVVHLTPKAFDTLVVLVENAGRLVTKDELMGALWPATYVEDVTLARNISDLRKALAECAPETSFIETVPKHGYRFVAEVRRGAAPDVETGGAESVADQPGPVETTAHDVSTPPVVVAPSVAAGSSRGRVTAWALAAALVMLAATAALIAWSGWSRSTPDMAPSGATRSLAILPFRVVGDDARDDYLGLGIADTLNAQLHRFRGLSVRPSSAVSHFDRTRQDAVAYGRALGVDALIDGSIRRSNHRLRVSIQLIDVVDESMLWADQFETSAADLFSVEDSVANRVGQAVASALGVDHAAAPRPADTVNSEARLLYLEGRYLWNKRTPRDLEDAVGLMEQAVQLDPDYALAHAGLADAYLFSATNPGDVVPRARAAAERALALDPTLAHAHASLGLIAMNHDWNWAEAERQFTQAIALNPNYATAHHWYGEFLAYMGRFDEALAENARARELDPLSTAISTDHAKILLLARRWQGAIDQLHKTLEMNPNHLAARITLPLGYLGSGRTDEAEAVVATLDSTADNPLVLMMVAVVDAEAGKVREARATLDRLTALSKTTYVLPAYLAYVQMRVGLLDEAFQSLERMCDERSVGVIGLRLDPVYDPIRREPRFQALLRRVGLGQSPE